MTNAEKYIGDEDTIDEFIDEMADHIIENTDPFWKEDKNFLMGVLQKFFKKEVKQNDK